MKQMNREGILTDQPDGQERFLSGLYGSAAGRALLKVLTRPSLSCIAGKILSMPCSKVLISPFIRANHIDMSQYRQVSYNSYNDFFSREIRPETRPIDPDPQHLISPCDSKLTVLPVTKDGVFHLKQREYTLSALLKNGALAQEYEGGTVLIFRLCVDDYHRYCYVCDGEKGENISIAGRLHTVNPIANDHYPIYHENSREYTRIRTEVFGDILVMEVGALLVGKIINHHGKAEVKRGQEKGYFQFGGSTVVLVLKSGAVQLDDDILRNSENGIETLVKMGEKIGTAISDT